MNTKILATLVAAALLSGCAATNKATNPEGTAATSTDAGYDKYENYQNTNDDEYLRMKVQNPSLWGSIDDYSYWNNSQYDFGYSCDASRDMLLTSFYSPYGFGYSPFGYYGGFGFGYGWNSWYSPYQTVVMYKNPTVYYGSTTKAASGSISPAAFHYTAVNNANINKTLSASRGFAASGSANNTYRAAGTNSSSSPFRATSSPSSNFSSGRTGGFSGGGFRAGGGRH